ncbi:MAG: type II/IV secretion system protein [Oscillospiraceae bacterium]|nr:type II/IV secretion system protein [Oscillospiraceae bacterium]
MLTSVQADQFREENKKTGKSIRELLIDSSFVSEENLVDALAAATRLPVIRLYEQQIPLEVRQIVRADLLRTHQVIPFGFDPEDSNTILVALNDPMNIRGRELISIASKCRIRPYLATTSDILLTIDRYYGTEEMKEAVDMYTRDNEQELSIEDELIREDVNSSPVVMLVNSMVEQAVRQRASDIHVEAEPDRVRVRYRVDGVLYTSASYNLKLLSAIVARIKIISGLDISEKRKPQDGRFSITVDHREYDIRVSTLPTVYGEKCVLRLNQKKALSRNKKTLGLSDEDLVKFDKILSRPNGIVLVTGPTGSGKSTTLYTALSELNSEKVNIITVEDPVEANIEGINQVQVNVKANLTFASALRSILRQDPDIIMIGEIRDGETASIAVQASITGHLVVSTLHTNDTASSVTRLLDMGVESYLIADSTVGIIAQRLVRRLCPHCKKERAPMPHEADYLGLSSEEREKQVIYESVGCQRCNGTGFFGRIGVYEIMEITPRLRGLIAGRASTDTLRQAALDEGMLTLKQSVRRLVLDGTTALSEMYIISVEDSDRPNEKISADEETE